MKRSQSRGRMRTARAMWGYEVPDPLRSDKEYARYYHLDLDGMNARALWIEQQRLGPALAHADNPFHAEWFNDRLTRVLAARGGESAPVRHREVRATTSRDGTNPEAAPRPDTFEGAILVAMRKSR